MSWVEFILVLEWFLKFIRRHPVFKTFWGWSCVAEYNYYIRVSDKFCPGGYFFKKKHAIDEPCCLIGIVCLVGSLLCWDLKNHTPISSLKGQS